MDVYNAIVDGFKKHISGNGGIDAYLQSLQKSVKSLRIAYRNSPVFVPYDKTDIQAAYLATYLPHYYQLIYQIFIEEVPDIFKGKKDIYLSFIGGGPGSEAYGAIKYIVNNCPDVKNIYITILDINASTWSFSHTIVKEHLVEAINSGNVKVHWNAISFDLVSEEAVRRTKPTIAKSDLLVIQNCLNEIASTNLHALKNNIEELFDYLPGNAFLLMSDLTSGARPTIKSLEKHLVDKFAPKFLKTTLSLSSAKSLISVHHKPSPIIAKNLLVGTDGLIPRKNLSYDYSLVSKGSIEEEINYKALGFAAIYRPLDFKNLDANDYIHKKIFVGIDFGTSSTVVSTAQLIGDKIIIKSIPIKQKDHSGSITTSPLVPTIISLVNGNRLLIGIHAADHKPYLEYGVNCWHSFKQNLHKLDQIEYPQSVLANNPSYKIANGRDGLVFFFKYLKDQTFEYLQTNGLPLEVEYSISVPASFSSKEKIIFKSCLLAAGIECEDTPFMEEPNAALINYLFEQNISFAGESPKTILVLDLGAGTVDVSLLQVENGEEGFTSKLLSVVRLGTIGGNLIDKLMADLITRKAGISFPLNEALAVELIAQAERLKIKLCKGIVTDHTVSFSLPDSSRSDIIIAIPSSPKLISTGISTLQITCSEFYQIMLQYWKGEDPVAGIETTIEKALKNANIDSDSVDKVLVTGGGGRNPYIKNFVANYFNSSEVIISDNIQEQVSRGVALQSFVLNSFGKNIITPILGHDIWVKGANKSILLFDDGISIPSMDVEIFLVDDAHIGEGHVECYSDENSFDAKYFVIPNCSKVNKLVFYIAPDQELKCEIVGKDKESEAQIMFEKPSSRLINLKQAI
jgi:molecular chaperone DnaK (HSP70)